MPKITENIDVNAAGGDLVDVACSIPCRHMLIEEDPNNGAAAKLSYQLASEGFAITHKLEAGGGVELGNKIYEGNAGGTLLGLPMQNGTAVPWAVGDTFDTGDLVVHNGRCFMSAIDSNLGTDPDSDCTMTPWLEATPKSWIVVANYVPATVVAKIISQGVATKARVTETE